MRDSRKPLAALRLVARASRPGVMGLWLALGVSRGAFAAPPSSSEGVYTTLPAPPSASSELPTIETPVRPPRTRVPEPPAAAPNRPSAQVDPAQADLEAELAAVDTTPWPEPVLLARTSARAELEAKAKPKCERVRHEILPGERIDEIAARYGVHRNSIARWNKLDKKHPKLYAGRKLKICAKRVPPPRRKITYVVKKGDTWDKIAAKHGVDPLRLRKHWNRKVPRKFRRGQKLIIWVEDRPVEAAAAAGDSGALTLPVMRISQGAYSTGKPNRGRIVNSARLPENEALYHLRKPEQSYGATHTLTQLQWAIATWRQRTGFTGKLQIGSISKRGGGRLRPHSSHQSGRDVDIRLPLVPGTEKNDSPTIDWGASWALIRALIDTGEIEYIFLTHYRQRSLYRAAQRAGVSKTELAKWIQYPRKSGTNNGIVRHSKGHTHHIHIRFRCAKEATNCVSY